MYIYICVYTAGSLCCPPKTNTTLSVCWKSTLLLLFRHSVVSDSWQPQGLQHAGLFCPSPSPGVCSNSCPLSRGCYLAISFSAAPFSFCLRCFPAFVSVDHLKKEKKKDLLCFDFSFIIFSLLSFHRLGRFLQKPQWKSTGKDGCYSVFQEG